MKKTKLFTLMAMLFVMVFSFALSSCSKDDDDNVGSNSIVGTWKIITDTSNENVGQKITFNNDGTITTEILGDRSDKSHYKDTWALYGNNLDITFGHPEPDDGMYGSWNVNGKKATYNYYWWTDPNDKERGKQRGQYIMTLEKQ